MSIQNPHHGAEKAIIDELAGVDALNAPKIVDIFAFDIAGNTVVVDSAGRILVSASGGAWAVQSFPTLPPVA